MLNVENFLTGFTGICKFLINIFSPIFLWYEVPNICFY